MVFIFFTLILAIALTFIELKVHYLPLALAAAISWLSLAAGIMLGAAGLAFPLSSPWVLLLSTVLVLMAFVPAGHFIMQMGKAEITITDQKGRSYKMWGKPTKAPIMSRSAQVQNDYAKRMHSVMGNLPTPRKSLRRQVR